MPKVTFYRTTAAQLPNLGRSDGQLIYTEDTGECFMDTISERVKISDIQIVNVEDIQQVTTPYTTKLYYSTNEQRLYKYDGTNWINLSSETQVYYWDGTSGPASVETWNNVYQLADKYSAILFDSDNELVFIHSKNDFSTTITAIRLNNPTLSSGVSNGSITYRTGKTIACTVTNDVVTRLTITAGVATTYNFLETDKNYSAPYTPQFNGSPANKKYVDDGLSTKQNQITVNAKLSADLVDDTNTTNKFISTSERNQIATNTSAIAGIKDGTTIDSFADVETALGNKQDTINGNHKLSSDLVDDTDHTNKFVTAAEKLKIAAVDNKVDKTSIVSEVTASSTNDQVPGAKLFYDTIGNVETLLTTLDIGGGVE